MDSESLPPEQWQVLKRRGWMCVASVAATASTARVSSDEASTTATSYAQQEVEVEREVGSRQELLVVPGKALSGSPTSASSNTSSSATVSESASALGDGDRRILISLAQGSLVEVIKLNY